MLVQRSHRIALLSSVAPAASSLGMAKADLAVPMGASHAMSKAIGADKAPRRGAKPSLYKLTDAQAAKCLGANSSLAKQINIYHARVAEKSLAKSFEKAIEMIGQQQAGDPDSSISLNVDKLKKVSKEDAIAAIMKGSDEEQGDNNQTYPRNEVGALMHYLEAVAGKGAQLYMARWDDISSEYIGTMIAVQNPKTKELTLAQIIGFLP